MIFPGMSTPLSEGTSADTWTEYQPSVPEGNNSIAATSPMCITFDYSKLTDGSADTYQVLGSNIGPAGADTVVVEDEQGSSTARLLTVPFIRPNFPFAWIGIRYTKGGGTVTGTYVAYLNHNTLSVTLN